MDSPWAEKNKAIEELIKGKESLINLIKLMEEPSNNINNITRSDHHVLLDLAAGVSASFQYAIHLLNSGRPSGGGGEISDVTLHRKSVDPAARKNRRGCYKRRKKSNSSHLSPSIEDGYAWRKYGQKFIDNHIFPRCYFRCTHKKSGCKATKQVQRWEKDESLYHTTYFGEHTCSNKIVINGADADTNPTHDDHPAYNGEDFDSTATPTSGEMNQYPLEDKNDIVVKEMDVAMNWSDLTIFDHPGTVEYDYGAVDMDNVDFFVY